MSETSPELLETVDCLCLASRRVARAITQAFDRRLRTHGLRSTQFTLLAVLALAGERSVNQLAAAIGADRTTLSRNMDLAEARGLIASRRADGDARIRLARITPQGRDVLEAALASWREVQAGLTAQLGADAAESLRRLGRESSTRTGRRSAPARRAPLTTG